MGVAPFSEVTVSIWTSSILKESRSVHKAGGEQHLGGEEFLLTEVAVEDGEEDKESPDHNDDQDLLVIVEFVPDLAGLWLDRPEVGALIEPLCEVADLLGLSDPEDEVRAVDDPAH